MKKYFMMLFYLMNLFSYNSLASNIYQWQDSNGIDQFSHVPPPISCKTDSCQKIHAKQKNLIAQNKIKRAEKLENERVKSETESLKKTTLAKDQSLCLGYDEIKEYSEVEIARDFLVKDKKCFILEEKVKYSFISEYKKFSKIRIYHMDGRSYIRWIETKDIVKP